MKKRWMQADLELVLTSVEDVITASPGEGGSGGNQGGNQGGDEYEGEIDW